MIDAILNLLQQDNMCNTMFPGLWDQIPTQPFTNYVIILESHLNSELQDFRLYNGINNTYLAALL